jgi:adenylate kinase family enzyme
MRRILVAGSTGAGKSTLAGALAQRLALPYYEMDALHSTGPGWRINDDFAAQVAGIAATPGWIFDFYGYPEVRDLLWEHADTVIRLPSGGPCPSTVPAAQTSGSAPRTPASRRCA